jgi:type IX secretion system PorP/SprF family membrane protein
MKKLILLPIVCLMWMAGYSQQHPMLSQYMFNGLILNPAYAGSKDYISTGLLYRKQWVEFDGAPVTQTAFIHGPLKSRKVGIGFSLINDKIGVTNRTDAYGSYAYHLKVGERGKFSMGLQAGVSYYNARLSDLIYWDKNDPVFAEEVQTNLLPNAGVGVYYYERKFYAGLSVPHLLSYDPQKSLSFEVEKVPHQVRHYFFSSGYVAEVNDDFKIKPSVLVKYVPDTPVEFDINCNVLLANTFWIGASYRTGDAIVGIIEYQITRKMRLGYSYDATISDIRNHSSGSHEIMLGYDFGYDIMKMKTPRYF